MSDTSSAGTAALCGSLLGLTTIAVVFRFNARLKQKSGVRIDDWMMIPTWIMFLALVVDMFYGISKKMIGYKEPYHDGKPVEPYLFIEILFVLDVVAVLSLGTVKLSALFFYRRIFCTVTHRDAFSILTWVFIALITLYSILYFIMCFTLCASHIQGHWTIEGRKSCPDLTNFLSALVYTDVVFEFLVLILPIPKIWCLHLPTKRRLAICGVFSLAIIGFASSCARLAGFLQLDHLDGEDLFRANTRWAFFTVLEAGFTIIAVNLPSLWYYVADVHPEGILRSVRSVLSLHSRSSGSADRGEKQQRPGCSGDTYNSGRIQYSNATMQQVSEDAEYCGYQSTMKSSHRSGITSENLDNISQEVHESTVSSDGASNEYAA